MMAGGDGGAAISLEALAAHDTAFEVIEAGGDPSAYIAAHSQVAGWLDRIHPAGKTLLRCAVDNQRHATISALITAGASVLVGDLYGINALHAACKTGDIAAVRAIIEASATLGICDTAAQLRAADQEGSTALHFGAVAGSTAVIEYLLRAGADVSAVDGVGSTALHSAAEAGHPAAVKVLLAAGAEHQHQNKIGNTPLHRAARHGYAEAVEALISRGADPLALNGDGLTPFDLAKKAARLEGIAVPGEDYSHDEP